MTEDQKTEMQQNLAHELHDHMTEMFLKMRESGMKIGAFKPRFNPTRVCMGLDTKKDWIAYRYARDAYKSLWIQYQTAFETNLLDRIKDHENTSH
jgi:hypothetical protein